MSILEIELTPEMERRLREKAKSRGQEAKAYVQTMVLHDLSQVEDSLTPDNDRPFNVMEFHGAGRDAWKDIDVQNYLRVCIKSH